MTLGVHWGGVSHTGNSGWLGWTAAGKVWSLDTHVLLITMLSQKKHTGWSCFSLGANYIPRIPYAPTHALLGEKRKRKMRTGSWGTDTDPKTVASLRGTGTTRHRLWCLHLTLSTGLSQNKETKSVKVRRHAGRRLPSPQDRSWGTGESQPAASCPQFGPHSRVLALEALPGQHFACLSINISMSHSLHLTYTQHSAFARRCVLFLLHK